MRSLRRILVFSLSSSLTFLFSFFARLLQIDHSGKFHEKSSFESAIKSNYQPLLQTEGYRFVGDASAWQLKNGHEKFTAVKEYLVELKTAKGEHLLVSFKLVYDWLLYCHLIATVRILSAMSSKAFPGTEEIDLDI